MNLIEIALCVCICGILACMVSAANAIGKLRSCISDLQESCRLSWSTEDTITRRLNRLETKLDSESVDRREAGDFVWDKVKELCETVQKIATDTEAHEKDIEILRYRTNAFANPLFWKADPPCPQDTSTTSPSTPL